MSDEWKGVETKLRGERKKIVKSKGKLVEFDGDV